MTTTPTAVPKTGPGSTSFLVHAVAVVTGLVTMALAAFTHATATATGPVHEAGVISGAVLVLGSTIAKLLHDQGIHVATIAAVGHDITATLAQVDPGLEAKIMDEVNKVKTDLEARLTEALSHVPDAAAIETAIRSALAALATQPLAQGGQQLPAPS